jgi:hypothetical protein
MIHDGFTDTYNEAEKNFGCPVTFNKLESLVKLIQHKNISDYNTHTPTEQL